MNPRVIEVGTKEYKNMMAVAKMLEAISSNGIRYEVENCYFDIGQDWMQTTIIAHNDKESGILSSYQAINPKEWGHIVCAQTVEDLAECVNEITGKFLNNK